MAVSLVQFVSMYSSMNFFRNDQLVNTKCNFKHLIYNITQTSDFRLPLKTCDKRYHRKL